MLDGGQMEDRPNYLGANFKHLRTKNGLTVKEVADNIGVKVRRLRRLENGKTIVKMGVASKLAIFFGVSLKDMLYTDLKEQEK